MHLTVTGQLQQDRSKSETRQSGVLGRYCTHNGSFIFGSADAERLFTTRPIGLIPVVAHFPLSLQTVPNAPKRL